MCNQILKEFEKNKSMQTQLYFLVQKIRNDSYKIKLKINYNFDINFNLNFIKIVDLSNLV